MSFKHEFLTALKGGKDYPALLELARRQHTQGRPQQETYQILQEIWLEFGFDTSPDGGALQNNLEAVMEKVWYECPT